MNINDLESCELVEFDNQILGGANTYANADTYAYQGIAFAGAQASANGNVTTASTDTYAQTSQTPVTSYSYASAYSNATAKDDNSYSWSSDGSISIWVSN